MCCYIATRCLWIESSRVRIVWIRLRRIIFKQLSERTCSCSCLSWLSCREVMLSFLLMLQRLIVLSCFAFRRTTKVLTAGIIMEMGYHQVILKGLNIWICVSDVSLPLNPRRWLKTLTPQCQWSLLCLGQAGSLCFPQGFQAWTLHLTCPGFPQCARS